MSPRRPRPLPPPPRRAPGTIGLTALCTLLAAAPAAAQRVPRPGGAGTAGVRPPGAPPPDQPVGQSAEDSAAARRAAGGPPGGDRAAAPRRAAPAAGARGGPDSLRTVPVSGVVYDSLAGAPLAGAVVQIANPADPNRTYTTRTDSAGRYTVGAVRVGRYLAGFFHPSVDALGVELAPLVVDVRADSAAARIDLATPSGEQLLPALCGNNAPATRVGGATVGELLRPPRPAAALLGTVRDADSNEPVPAARVVITWTELQTLGNAEGGGATLRNVNRRLPVRVRPDGGFVACGLPSDVDLVMSADAPKRATGLIEVRLAARELVRRDFLLGDSASVITVTLPDTGAARAGQLAVPVTVARGQARLQGVVRGPGGAPLAGARVSVAGTDVGGTTSPNGTFALAGLPAGTYTLEVKAIGYAPTRVAVNLSRARPAQVAVTVSDRLNTLESVVVQADRTKLDRDFTGFTERARRGGFGRYITEEDVQKRGAFLVTDVLRTTPGIQVVPNGGLGYTVRGRGGCAPDLFIDGMRVMDGTEQIDQLVQPQDVGGIEVYPGGVGAPPQLQGPGGSSCGVVAVWTRRGRRPSS